MHEKLIALQRHIYQYHNQHEAFFSLSDSTRLYFLQVGELYDLKFYGEGYDDYPTLKAEDFGNELNFGFCALLDFIGEQAHADKIAGLSFDGPDVGANGSNCWDFTRLVHSNIVFPNLTEFKVKLMDLGHHNQSIIDGEGLREEGMVAKLLAKMPNLHTLVVPSAPDNTFFQIGEHPLRELTLQAGYDHQDFIDNLATSRNFKSLTVLDYTERFDGNGDPDKKQYTAFDAFKQLFTSEAFSSVVQFRLRGSNLTREELFELQRLNPLQFHYVNCQTGRYVSNMMNEKRH